MRNLLTHAPAKQRPAVIAIVKTIFAQQTAAEAPSQWKTVADVLRERAPKLAALMDASLDYVLAYTAFPKEHWLRSPAPTRSNASTGKSSAGPTSLASFRTIARSSASLAR
jgi:transposase-like protein